MNCNTLSFQELLGFFDNDFENNLENNYGLWSIHNTEKLQEFLNRIMQRIMCITIYFTPNTVETASTAVALMMTLMAMQQMQP